MRINKMVFSIYFIFPYILVLLILFIWGLG